MNRNNHHHQKRKKEKEIEEQEQQVNDGDDEIEEESITTEISVVSNKEALSAFLQNKPKEFIDFLVDNNIPQDSYDINLDDLPRFIRLNNRLILEDGHHQDGHHDTKQQTVKQIEQELKTPLKELAWLPNFYQLKSTVGISSSPSYKKGIMYGMDASSGAAILALDPQPGDNVLDICCAPGTKFCMIADLIKGQGSVTGVDISPSRLGSCKTVIKKYKIPKARLFQCDATTFNIKAPSSLDPLPHLSDTNVKKRLKKKQKNDKEQDKENVNGEGEEEEEKELENTTTTTNIEKKRKSKKNTKKIKYDLPDLYFSTDYFMRYSNSLYYDRVIVDAECSLDASIRHLIQYSKIGRNFIPSELTELTNLQKKLLQTGFNLLKEGGVLVYSTCSFCKAENEDVVTWLLENNPNSQLEPCFGDTDRDTESDGDGQSNQNITVVPFSRGYIKHTYRFYPKNGTSGMFIARIVKMKSTTTTTN
ncbi:Putative nucleolar protein [Cavenderia fasciculata]|uniref:Nucleolar protein n=1 Tax=Cavenderia fasciculata TaxID=261658 RepID=F4PU09_CACFS|nr:Putative nucleolar protein [Cavenderia fasciculata]EGG21777.1 Putative nucleolar protein [Cavenderia fasciculata]|eukprot:XP_004359627.1 Putative nucleolar protein [Cavenderia fasciculata]